MWVKALADVKHTENGKEKSHKKGDEFEMTAAAARRAIDAKQVAHLKDGPTTKGK